MLLAQGLDIKRAVLAFWVGYAAAELKPLYIRLRELILASGKIAVDETVAPVLDPGRGRTKKGYFWAIARDDRPWSGTDPPAVTYSYAPGRGAVHALKLLEHYRGIVQCDGYAAYKSIADAAGGEAITLAFCWAHLRRRFFDIAKDGSAPIASEALERIAALYAIEKTIRGHSSCARRATRQEKSKPLVLALKKWFEQQLGRVSAKSVIAEAIRYALHHWDGLTRFLDDGRIELDTNVVERSIRTIVLNRKNALFAGHDQGAENWAAIASLIETCLCRARHRQVYAARRTMPNGSGMTHRYRGAVVGRVDVGSVPFGIVWSAQSASRKASRRSLGRKRVRLPRSYGLSLARAASLSARCACR